MRSSRAIMCTEMCNTAERKDREPAVQGLAAILELRNGGLADAPARVLHELVPRLLLCCELAT